MQGLNSPAPKGLNIEKERVGMEYVYPAIFHLNQDDGSYTITYPDLPGCISEGNSLGNAMLMAQAALTQWIEYHNDKKLNLAPPSLHKDIKCGDGEFVNLVMVEVRDNLAVKRTISLPKWMDEQAQRAKLSLSKVLQEALFEKLA